MSPIRLRETEKPVGLLAWGAGRGLEDRTASGSVHLGATRRAGLGARVAAHVGGLLHGRELDAADVTIQRRYPARPAFPGRAIVVCWTPLAGSAAMFGLDPTGSQVDVWSANDDDWPEIERVVDEIRRHPRLGTYEGWVDCTGTALALATPTAGFRLDALDEQARDLVALARSIERRRLAI